RVLAGARNEPLRELDRRAAEAALGLLRDARLALGLLFGDLVLALGLLLRIGVRDALDVLVAGERGPRAVRIEQRAFRHVADVRRDAGVAVGRLLLAARAQVADDRLELAEAHRRRADVGRVDRFRHFGE